MLYVHGTLRIGATEADVVRIQRVMDARFDNSVKDPQVYGYPHPIMRGNNQVISDMRELREWTR